MRETILLDALEEIKEINAVSMAGNSWVYHKDEIKKVITKALSDWASAPKEGLTWVISNKRRPDKDGLYYAEDSIGTKTIARFYNNHWDSETEHPISKWLDESSAPESGQNEDNSYYNLEGLSNEQKDKLIGDFMATVSKEFLKIFFGLGLKTHMEQMITEQNSGKEFILSFRTLSEHIKTLPAPESGGEEMIKLLNFLFDEGYHPFPKHSPENKLWLQGGSSVAIDAKRLIEKFKKDFVPNKSTPSTSSNSIEHD